MIIDEKYRKMANRHSARLLSKLEQVHDLSVLAIEAVQREMHYLAEDVVKEVESIKEEVNGNR